MSKEETKSIILLSGGLDSVVSLALVREKLNVTLALTFDYGQKSATKEIEASAAIAKHYGLEHKVIKLDWLKEITHTALCSNEEVPTGDALKNEAESAKSVWVPNRNGLFLNIAGAFADADGYTSIIIGANKEEAQTFPDNTKDFIERVNAEFEFSTRVQPKVVAPLIDSDKIEIVRLALSHNAPLELLNSCYANTQKHCGKCESCVRLKRALEANNDTVFIKKLFEE
ncbi:MAG: 7-cyano-7-deazaguanine synthase QueC [Fusobacterium sp.]|nr:7-cyano-7-deazaguanine synthase QueC [Fusobacterium sp.]